MFGVGDTDHSTITVTIVPERFRLPFITPVCSASRSPPAIFFVTVNAATVDGSLYIRGTDMCLRRLPVFVSTPLIFVTAAMLVRAGILTGARPGDLRRV